MSKVVITIEAESVHEAREEMAVLLAGNALAVDEPGYLVAPKVPEAEATEVAEEKPKTTRKRKAPAKPAPAPDPEDEEENEEDGDEEEEAPAPPAAKKGKSAKGKTEAVDLDDLKALFGQAYVKASKRDAVSALLSTYGYTKLSELVKNGDNDEIAEFYEALKEI